ncbi:uncharacterized protein TRIADDRAFT_56667 [Trichoplax adhaerens]|uniref:Jacalin-type lectin domain-containing protein n=1 Tax=Trichoplax adhaerens TaxID=10228 RepID=B3RW92_TRIAD|nr:predicted protein [Trichoplax adhaerens]EDV24651.1 predicted protein [Trichoplax adhaerens]|eukprot:XP_002112541.1 predicted protein [Trichoplax adhaerens]
MADMPSNNIMDKYINLPTFICKKNEQHGVKGDYFKCRIKAKLHQDNEDYFQLSNDKGDILLIKAAVVMQYLTDGGWRNNLIDEIGPVVMSMDDGNVRLQFILGNDCLITSPIGSTEGMEFAHIGSAVNPIRYVTFGFSFTLGDMCYVQIQFQDKTVKSSGTKTPCDRIKSIKLTPNEKITSAYIQISQEHNPCYHLVQGIRIETSLGQQLSFGKIENKQTKHWLDIGSGLLVGVIGRYSFYIHSLGLIFTKP